MLSSAVCPKSKARVSYAHRPAPHGIALYYRCCLMDRYRAATRCCRRPLRFFHRARGAHYGLSWKTAPIGAMATALSAVKQGTVLSEIVKNALEYAPTDEDAEKKPNQYHQAAMRQRHSEQ